MSITFFHKCIAFLVISTYVSPPHLALYLSITNDLFIWWVRGCSVPNTITPPVSLRGPGHSSHNKEPSWQFVPISVLSTQSVETPFSFYGRNDQKIFFEANCRQWTEILFCCRYDGLWRWGRCSQHRLRAVIVYQHFIEEFDKKNIQGHTFMIISHIFHTYL